jgi:hypothetical protein
MSMVCPLERVLPKLWQERLGKVVLIGQPGRRRRSSAHEDDGRDGSSSSKGRGEQAALMLELSATGTADIGAGKAPSRS